jgi:hypothetical protein
MPSRFPDNYINKEINHKTNKILLKAVADGTKPAALIPSWYEDLVKESGLCYIKTEFDEFVVAKNQEKIDEIRSIQERFNGLHEELGIALGFPKTAVKVYASKVKKKDFAEVPEKYMGFFAFSDEHYEDEIKVIDSWLDSANKIKGE